MRRIMGGLERVELVDPAEIFREPRHPLIAFCELRTIRQM
jgi:hypothetical protein